MQIDENKKNIKELHDLCVVQIYNKYTKNHLFAIVYKIEHEKVFWYNPMSHTKEQITEEAFWELFTGCILVCDTHVKQTRPYEEEGYHLKRKEEKYSLLWQYVILVIFPLVLVAFGIKISLMGFSLYPLLLVILFSIGLFVSVLLMFYEIDQFNPSLSKVCQAGRKVSCQAVLNSVGAHFCGVSWSVWGSSYFGGILLTLVTVPSVDLGYLTVLSYISLFSTVYPVYSVIYQKYVVKQWCPLCLSVQVILVLIVILFFIGGFYNVRLSEVDFSYTWTYAVSVMLTFGVMYILFNLIKKSKIGEFFFYAYQLMKRDSVIFKAMLDKQESNMLPIGNLGITLGNPNGKIHLVKVCNPFCKACAESHRVLEKLLDLNPNLCLQMVFTTTSDINDGRLNVVSHFLCLRSSMSQEELRNALDVWYLSENMTYELFDKLYPVKKECLFKYAEEINEMRIWTEGMKVENTPTFYINGKLVPDIYSIDDIKCNLLD